MYIALRGKGSVFAAYVCALFDKKRRYSRFHHVKKIPLLGGDLEGNNFKFQVSGFTLLLVVFDQ